MAYFTNLQFSTTNMISGYEIVEQKGIVFERVVSGVGLVSELFAGLTDVFGGRSGRMEEQLDNLYIQLFSAMEEKAKRIQANAIVGFSIDIDEISGKGTSMLMISGVGTAVIARPVRSTPENKSARTKATMWTCVKCGMANSYHANFCPRCGEKRHFEWKCQNCNTDNLAEFNFCPSCGKPRTLEEENIVDASQSALRDFDPKDLISTLQNMKNAAEIHEYLKETLPDETDEETEYLLGRIEDIAHFERIYGNSKHDAIKVVEGFLEHDCQVYPIDKKRIPFECPCCGMTMENAGMSCPDCGALFKYLE